MRRMMRMVAALMVMWHSLRRRRLRGSAVVHVWRHHRVHVAWRHGVVMGCEVGWTCRILGTVRGVHWGTARSIHHGRWSRNARWLWRQDDVCQNAILIHNLLDHVTWRNLHRHGYRRTTVRHHAHRCRTMYELNTITNAHRKSLAGIHMHIDDILRCTGCTRTSTAIHVRTSGRCWM